MQIKCLLYFLVFFSLIFTNGCSEKPVVIRGVGAVCEQYMWIEGSSLGNSGGCSGGLTPPPLPGSMLIDEEPMPERFNIRWFNFAQQRFYEAAIYDPEMPKRAKEIVKKHNVNGNQFESFRFIAVIANSGEVTLWLSGRDRSRRGLPTFEEKFGAGQGYEIFGDPKGFRKGTERARKEGRIPQEPLPPPPATQPPREEMSIEDFWFDMPEKKKRARYNPIR